MNRIDPVERALDAYGALDTDQKLIFEAAVRHINRAISQLSQSVDYCPPKDETKRRPGRPLGSRNRKPPIPTELPMAETDAEALQMRLNNGAITEGL